MRSMDTRHLAAAGSCMTLQLTHVAADMAYTLCQVFILLRVCVIWMIHYIPERLLILVLVCMSRFRLTARIDRFKH